jgi:class 3 adenylate cyclase/tetratricopeptide (TPR) repeat protein
MTFDELLAQVTELLQRQGRVSYGALKRRFALDDDYLQDLKDELIDAQRVASDEDGKVLVWVGGATVASSQLSVASSSQPPTPQTSDSGLRTPDSQSQTLDSRLRDSRLDAAERRQLTVLFCDLVDSTTLSTLLDPEELREVVRAYQETCTDVIRRYEGHIAQHLGDGLLVYFSYPQAHEDDAQRAVRTGLEILAGLQALNAQLQPAIKERLPHPIQVRIGIHTGLVVVGEIGSSEKREILALGETPNIAARLQGLAEPDTVVLSMATQRLVQGLFECQELGPQTLKGISTPLLVYRVMRESEAQSRFEAAVSKGLTPLVGREEELGLLRRRWERAKEGEGQVVLLSGEPGIGKSRLVQTLKEQVIAEGATRIEFRCSPYHQNSAFYPLIEHLQRLLLFAPQETLQSKLSKLQQVLAAYRFPQADTLPLLAALLSLPHPEGSPPLTLSPQKQKQKTQEALVAWMVEETERAAAYCAWEDLHWADPSTLEVLTLFLDQVPTTRMFTVLTFRPDFTPPWRSRAHITQLTLNRLGRPQVEAMVEKVTEGKALPGEVLQQIVTKTDGVPLFVEELTKAVVESGLLREVDGHYELTGLLPPLAIPATLQDSLMARLDRLAAVREVAQLGATLGREFSYELLQAVSPVDENTLRQGLRQLVETDLLYQRGLLPQAIYLFKHALIQDVAYQSLLKSKRQQYHQQIAQVLEERFAEVKETQPELLAHHYTEAGLKEQAIPYWQQAGQRAIERSANVEAISHLTKGLELLQTLTDTPERAQQELRLQISLGGPMAAIKGWAAPETGAVYARARELCRQVGETPQIFPALWGLCGFYSVRAEYQTALELAKQLLNLAESVQDSALLLEAHYAVGQALNLMGEFPGAREHLEQVIALYDVQQHRSLAFVHGTDPGVMARSVAATVLWMLGYPEQALRYSRDALTLARELAHPFSLAFALFTAAALYHYRREGQIVQERAEACVNLSTEQGFPYFVALGTVMRGAALTAQDQPEAGIEQIRQGLSAQQRGGAAMARPTWLSMLATACGKVGQVEEGLSVLTEALAAADQSSGRAGEAEAYRLKGELTLQQFQVSGSKFQVQESPKSDVRSPESEAEEYFQKAIAVARKQQAKSLELRAVMSLAHLWQQQGKQHEARNMLSEICNWFTEGFDTKDLQEAKALLDSLESRV